MHRCKKFSATATSLMFGVALIATPAFAANTTSASGTGISPPAVNTSHQGEAQQLIGEATSEVRTMNENSQLRGLMSKAKGIYLVPEYGHGALVIGGRGGAGVVLAKNNGKWSDPAFYDLGGISIGAQVGAAGGKVAFLLMTDHAVNAFKSGNKISLNAGAGLTIVDFSHASQASWGKGDIIMWADNSGAYAGADISVTDLNWADNNNQSFYGRKVQPDQVLAGDVNTPDATQLKDALASS